MVGIKQSLLASTLYMLSNKMQSAPQLSSQNDSVNTVVVAIVGGGITGSCAASELSKHFPNVVLFDQGQRGPGGRASHRSIRASDGKVLPDDDDDIAVSSGGDNGDSCGDETSPPSTFQFDHGCQFFRADSATMQNDLLPTWLSKGWVAPWEGRFGSLGPGKGEDFFGLPLRKEKVYIGVGGMHQLPRKILKDSKTIVHRGTRVADIQKNEQTGKWDVYCISGKAAYHDTKVADTKQASEEIIASADIVIFTDISSSFSSWHRASAGIPDSFMKKLPKQNTRIPLFTCMLALSYPVGNLIDLDGFTVGDATSNDEESVLWFAARSQSKPGFPECKAECWTLVSTPSYAVSQIRETTMRDPTTGEFRPQSNDYLNSVPGPDLFCAFLESIQPRLQVDKNDLELPKAVYLQAQRWGSGLPCPESLAGNVEEVCSTLYASNIKSSLVYSDKLNDAATDFVADDDLGLYYAGDFFSHRNPGFEAAALSGFNVGRHIAKKLNRC